MKTFFTLIYSFFLVLVCNAQTPLTIKASDIPIPNGTFTYDDFSTKNPTSPSIGTDKNWNYGTLFGNDSFKVTYFEEIDTFFTKFGVDSYVGNFKSLTPQLGYNLDIELDFNATGVEDKGVYISKQVYSLQNFTGNPADNLTFPLQGYVIDSPRKFMQFPMTANSSWSSVSTRINDFTLKIAAFGLNDVPSQHVYRTVRKDTIVGWGKLRVYTPQGPSIAYDVLVDKVHQYSIDSFFVGGALAPTALTNAFGIKQGQITDVARQYNFIRRGTYSYLMRFNYGKDSTYTKIESAFGNKDNLTTATSSSDDLSVDEYSTVLFPNPSTGQSINLVIRGKELNTVNYTLIDGMGKLIQAETNIEMQNNTLHILVNDKVLPGTYYLQVTDKDHKYVASEIVSFLR